MKTFFRKPLIASAALLLAVANLNGCFNEDTAGPDAPQAEAPALPAPDALTFQLGFFDQGATLQRSAGKANFVNAYLRVVIVQAITELMLAPPIAAFSLALHTPASPQADGSWIWVYTWVNGDEEAQIRLRGRVIANDRVAWEMRVSSTRDGYDKVLWFDGETGDEGDNGFFIFHDAERAGNPEAGRLGWGLDVDGHFLRFTDLIDNVGDNVEFRELGDLKQLTYTDASDDTQSWFVKWDEADGTGSLRAPDFNEGLEACWDDRQNDTDCAVPAF